MTSFIQFSKDQRAELFHFHFRSQSECNSPNVKTQKRHHRPHYRSHLGEEGVPSLSASKFQVPASETAPTCFTISELEGRFGSRTGSGTWRRSESRSVRVKKGDVVLRGTTKPHVLGEKGWGMCYAKWIEMVIQSWRTT